ncbi:hypothetical protein D8674_034626 [Pyrus ussuriensis x Pyrus communis]|uniref:Uncharacterized protein n=1 Tax=Pyrus ussuriensis x Pyrus communis TaxID=2448454 RepID=A0A5N5GFV5_9ROSA|nr:hypothetical protein D8674_034626 [Pyrus ussuriensis x Pyrus communis]
MKLRNCPCCPRGDLILQNLIYSFHCQDSTTAQSHRSPPKSKEDHVQTQFPQLAASSEAPPRLPILRRQSAHHLFVINPQTAEPTSLSLRRRLPSHRRTICMSFETSRASVISGILFEVSGEIWIPVKSVVKSLECQNRKTLRSFKSCCRYADLDCRMERMKNNCRKAAMETRQQQIQVDLGNLVVSKLFFFTYSIYLYFLVIFLCTSGLFEMISFERLIENLLLEIGILFGLIPSVKWQSLSEIWGKFCFFYLLFIIFMVFREELVKECITKGTELV